jgi:glycine/D-amino acid oxidase-like deaminating enzyme
MTAPARQRLRTARTFDVVVAGGGLVGMSLAYGLARTGRRVAVCDGDDTAYRAARGNFGLIWVQGKGGRCLPYAQWSLVSSQRWGAFAAQLRRETGVDPCFERPGGFELCETVQQLDEGQRLLESLRERDAGLDYQVLDNAALRRRIPAASSELAGALYSRNDGHASPLFTLRALHEAFQARGGVYLPRHDVTEVVPRSGHFDIVTTAATLEAGRVVLAAVVTISTRRLPRCAARYLSPKSSRRFSITPRSSRGKRMRVRCCSATRQKTSGSTTA